MRVNTKTNLTVAHLYDYHSKGILKANHQYQHGLTWSVYQKQMFIDSLFCKYPAPAFYFHKIKTELFGGDFNTTIEIIDGQQRVNAITEYFQGRFSLVDPKTTTVSKFLNFISDKTSPWAGKRFDELSDELKDRLREQKVVIYEITTDEDAEVRDLFIRLQAGVPLTAQDKSETPPRKRQSKHGEMPPNGTEMYMKYNNKRYEAEVREGAIILKHDNTSHSSLSGAAVHITKNSVNGWKYWYLKLPDSDGWISANEWRKR